MTDELKQWEYDRGYEKGKADVLDKIRAEIEQEYNRLSATRADETLELGECLGLKMSLKIIDKYRKGEQKTETWNGIHAQITAPKGTFDKIWEEADEEDYIEDDIERKLEWMEEQEYLDDKYGKEQE